MVDQTVLGQFAFRNRFATECARCSVLVLADGGVVRDDPVHGQIVLCLTCVNIDHDRHAEIRYVTPGAAQWITVLVLGFTRRCWHCAAEVVCVSGLYPHRPGLAAHRLMTTHDEPGRGMALAARMLDRIGRRDITATIESVFSQTLQADTMAVLCPHCRSMQGNFFVIEETTQRYLTAGLEGLDVLGHAPSPTREWQQIVHHPDLSWMLFGTA
ncbi:hypothetical protein [Nocardia sp. NPDC050710]|uniref:hypothetical protein n=1 Tax=Nocardia sp. NPDC050710 TaxID=3157220 RepID=UPI0033C2208C